MITWRTTRAALPYVIALFALIGVLMFWNGLARHIPFTAQWRAERLERRADYAEQDAANRGLEAQGNADTLQRVETYHTQEVIVRDLTSQAITEARTAPDAETPLSPERADRLRAHDKRLCDQFPGLCAGAATDAS